MPKTILITIEELTVEYTNNLKSMKEIAEQYQCSAQTICNLLKRFGIPTRSNKIHTERTKEKLSKQKTGENHPYYGKKRPHHAAKMKGKKPYAMTAKIRQNMSNSAKGKRLSTTTREKISASNKGKQISIEAREKISKANTGKHHTEQTRKKMSEAKHGMWGGKYIGRAHPNWKEPENRKTPLYRRIRSSSAMKTWRNSVFKRDNWTCQICGTSRVYMNADHIVSFAAICFAQKIDSLERAMTCKELWDISNGRTLCLECHKKTDTFARHLQKQGAQHDTSH